ncbi:MAG: GxxExxY protein [Opitutaceae bacterium]|nr:GxxExxY protein [Opitutaceae bacterium]
MTENEISRVVVDAAFKLHTELGPGLLESVYEVLLVRELELRGLAVVRQKPVAFEYRGMRFDEGFRADLMINDLVLIELKSVEQLHPVHKKQLKTYLKLTNCRLGLLINFGAVLIKDGIHRVVLGLPEEKPLRLGDFA